MGKNDVFRTADNDVQNAMVIDFLCTVNRATIRTIASRLNGGFQTIEAINRTRATIRRLERIGAVKQNGALARGWFVQNYYSVLPHYMNWHTIKDGRND